MPVYTEETDMPKIPNTATATDNTTDNATATGTATATEMIGDTLHGVASALIPVSEETDLFKLLLAARGRVAALMALSASDAPEAAFHRRTLTTITRNVTELLAMLSAGYNPDLGADRVVRRARNLLRTIAKL